MQLIKKSVETSAWRSRDILMWRMVKDACDEKWVISTGISIWLRLKEYCTVSFIRKLKLPVVSIPASCSGSPRIKSWNLGL